MRRRTPGSAAGWFLAALLAVLCALGAVRIEGCCYTLGARYDAWRDRRERRERREERREQARCPRQR